jgi:hypothetical protein
MRSVLSFFIPGYFSRGLLFVVITIYAVFALVAKGDGERVSNARLVVCVFSLVAIHLCARKWTGIGIQ